MHPEVQPACGDEEEDEGPQGQAEAPVLFVTGQQAERERQRCRHHGVGGGQAELIVPPELKSHCGRHRGPGTPQNFLQNLQ